MDKVNQKMKKFNLGRVLVGLRSSVSTPQKADVGIDESLRSEHFQIAKTVRHGFPFQPTALACDPVQNLLAIGTRNGSLKIFGQPGVECDVRHDGNFAVIQLMFLVNEGALVSVTADDQVHMWTLRQKKPEIVHSLKFQRERITFCHLPFQSKWLHIGTEKGNVHVVSLETFTLSGYVINWNKAMELIRLAHPGPIVHLSDCPMDPNKLLIGFETGAVVLWDLKNKVAEARFTCTETLKSACWHQDGKQFICSHGDGSLTVWNCKLPQRPQSFMMPHAKLAKDNKPELCKAISKVDYRSVRNGEPYIIFSGGTPSASQMPSLTLMHGNKMTVLEMEHPVVDFFTLCCTPWNNDFQDPNAIVVLLEKDLVVVDLNTEGFPCFENPYPMDIHESPVTACSYYADCPPDLVPAFYSVGCKRKRTGYSDKEWPIHGGEWTTPNCSYPEIIITGHADGSVKIWDASSVTLQVLYKLKTAKVFDPTKCKSLDDDDSPFAIQHIYLCVDSRLLCIAGLGHVVLFRFSKQELSLDCPVLEISIVYEIYDGVDTPDEFPIILPKQPLSRQSGSAGSYSNLVSNGKEPVTSVRAKTGVRKWPPGYQPDLCCLLTWIDNEPPPPITSLSVNSRFGLLAFGDECGIAIIDIIQKTCLLSMGTPDLYGSMDPYSRAPRSPKLKTQPKLSAFDLSSQALSDDCRSPTVEQQLSDLGSVSSPLDTVFDAKHLPCLTPAVGLATFKTFVGELESIEELASIESADFDDSASADKPILYEPSNLLSKHMQGVPGSMPDPSIKKERTDRHRFDHHNRDFVKPPARSRSTSLLKRLTHAKKREMFGSNKSFSEEISIQLSDDEIMQEAVSTPDVSKLAGLADPLAGSTVEMRQSTSGTNKGHRDSTTDDEMRKENRGIVRIVSGVFTKPKSRMPKVEVIDMSCDDPQSAPSLRKLTYVSYCLLDKTDSPFSRSHSSSTASLENVNKEAIECLVFADAYTRKSDTATCPCLWVGTSLGTVLVISLTLPSDNDTRRREPVIISPSGTIFRLKGSILVMSFLDCNGILIPTIAEQWKDTNREKEEKEKRSYNRQASSANVKSRISPTSSVEMTVDRQFAIICSEKQARVISLPSQTCIYKVKVTETSCVSRADVIAFKDSVCLSCYIANGHIIVFSLPSLKPLLDIDYIPFPDVRVARTICFSSYGHIIYMCSPSEIQKLTLSAETCENLKEAVCDLFLPCNMPEAPKQNFFKNLFTGPTAVVDREELFGENSGKASKGLTKYTPGPAGLAQDASYANSEIGRAKLAALERGEKLGELEERTERLKMDAEIYSQSAHQLKMKYKAKKWWQF